MGLGLSNWKGDSAFSRGDGSQVRSGEMKRADLDTPVEGRRKVQIRCP